jgi:two-component system, cell cycle response regulator DivK
MPTKTGPQPPPLVLVIDDAEDNREVYGQYFAFLGWRTATATDGQSGLERAAALMPNAIVLDLALPVVDGWEVARRLKKDPSTKAVPVIALTAHVSESARAKAVAAGVDDYFVKPCPPPELAAAIRRHLGETIMHSQWSAVDQLLREVGDLRNDARALPELEYAIAVEVDALITAAAASVNETLAAPEEEKRLFTACEAIVAARDVITALQQETARANALAQRGAELSHHSAELGRRIAALLRQRAELRESARLLLNSIRTRSSDR